MQGKAGHMDQHLYIMIKVRLYEAIFLSVHPFSHSHTLKLILRAAGGTDRLGSIHHSNISASAYTVEPLK